MEKLLRQLIILLGEDPDREGLLETPKRVSHSLKFLTSGYEKDINNVVGNAIFESKSSEMIVVKGIEFYSLCEHHMLPFFGICHIGYIPDKKVLGLSKFARIVDICSRKLQIQENLTCEIATILVDILKPKGIGIFVEAKHLCMMMRGVIKQNSTMITSQMLGYFLSNSSTRSEFINFVQKR